MVGLRRSGLEGQKKRWMIVAAQENRGEILKGSKTQKVYQDVREGRGTAECSQIDNEWRGKVMDNYLWEVGGEGRRKRRRLT